MRFLLPLLLCACKAEAQVGWTESFTVRKLGSGDYGDVYLINYIPTNRPLERCIVVETVHGVGVDCF